MSDENLERVLRAFDYDDLAHICEMHENEFADTYEMIRLRTGKKSKYYREEYNPFYCFSDVGSPILAVAHLDTVMPHSGRGATFADTADGPVVYSGALDDRLGAYTILELLPALGIEVDVLLTTGEESGCSTGEFFVPPREYNWMIEFDRGGTDVVMYQYEDEETEDLVRACGAKVGIGIFSDISYMEHLEVKGFNWGVGYQQYHGPRSHAFLIDYWSMLAKYLDFHEANADLYLPHDYRKRVNSRSSWGWTSADWDEDEELRAYLRQLDRDGVTIDDVIDADVVSEDFAEVNEICLREQSAEVSEA